MWPSSTKFAFGISYAIQFFALMKKKRFIMYISTTSSSTNILSWCFMYMVAHFQAFVPKSWANVVAAMSSINCCVDYPHSASRFIITAWKFPTGPRIKDIVSLHRRMNVCKLNTSTSRACHGSIFSTVDTHKNKIMRKETHSMGLIWSVDKTTL